MILVNLIKALQAGKELADPTTWKNRQVTINLLVILLSAIAALARLLGWVDISEEVLQDVAVIIATILGLVNVYLTLATSKKVGL